MPFTKFRRQSFFSSESNRQLPKNVNTITVKIKSHMQCTRKVCHVFVPFNGIFWSIWKCSECLLPFPYRRNTKMPKRMTNRRISMFVLFMAFSVSISNISYRINNNTLLVAAGIQLSHCFHSPISFLFVVVVTVCPQ